MADSNGDHVAIQKQLGEMGNVLARVEQKIDSLPCPERKTLWVGVDARIRLLEDVQHEMMGAGRTLKWLWGMAIGVGIILIRDVLIPAIAWLRMNG